jgi:hypothetical protein
LLLAGCQSIGVPERTEVPVPVSCLPKTLPMRPETFSDPQLAAMSDFHLVLGLRQTATRLHQYSTELEAVLVACR